MVVDSNGVEVRSCQHSGVEVGLDCGVTKLGSTMVWERGRGEQEKCFCSALGFWPFVGFYVDMLGPRFFPLGQPLS